MPPRGGRLRRKSPAGAVSLYSKRSPWGFSCFSCSRIYFRMVSSSRPTVLTQYPRDQKLSPVTRLLPALRWIRTALFPFRKPMTKAMLNFGGTRKHMWTWSGFRCPSNSSTPRCRHKSRKISPVRRFVSPYRDRLRYFGAMTTWYLQSHLTCDRLSHSCIGSSSSAHGRTFPEEEPILFLAGSVEPIRVHRWKRWF